MKDKVFLYSGFAILAALVLMASGCASSEAFLLNTLSPEAKAKALVDTGIEQYKVHLLGKKDYTQVKRIRGIFDGALTYDPANTTGRRYLDTIDRMVKTEFETNMAEAKRLSKKQGRKLEEDYALTVAIRNISALSPEDPEVRKLLRETEAARKNYLATRHKQIDELLVKAKAAKAQADKEKAYTSAFLAALEVSHAAPDDSRAVAYTKQLRAEVVLIIKSKLAGLDKLLTQATFTVAKAQFDQAARLNNDLDGEFTDEIAVAGHDLYYAWGKYLADRKDLENAAVRLDQALKYQRSAKALELRRQVAMKPVEPVDVGALLAAIDALISAEKLAEAARAIDNASDAVKAAGRTQELGSRNAKIEGIAKGLYDKGLQAYREERFQDAIAAFAPVQAWDQAYEQVSDYLQKAKDKQKILSNY